MKLSKRTDQPNFQKAVGRKGLSPELYVRMEESINMRKCRERERSKTSFIK